jgi:hypothetical protein
MGSKMVQLFALVCIGMYWGSSAQAQQENVAAQVAGTAREAEAGSEGWWGFQAEIAGAVLATEVELAGDLRSSVGNYAFPQPGIRLHLGLLMDKNSKNALRLIVGYGHFFNLDRGSNSVIQSTSLFDLGLESQSRMIRTKKGHSVWADYGTSVSLARVVGGRDVGVLYQWGVSPIVAVRYDYAFANKLHLGVRPYLRTGIYFGSRSKPLRFESQYELGLGLSLSM